MVEPKNWTKTYQPPDEQEENKKILASTQVGRRFIAQMTFYNQGNTERMKTFIEDGYHADLLAKESVADRVKNFQKSLETAGKMRVQEVISTTLYRLVLILQAEDGKLYYNRLKVEEDYPHRILQYVHREHS